MAIPHNETESCIIFFSVVRSSKTVAKLSLLLAIGTTAGGAGYSHEFTFQS